MCRPVQPTLKRVFLAFAGARNASGHPPKNVLMYREAKRSEIECRVNTGDLLEPPTGVEPVTPALQVRCSAGLSYGGPTRTEL